MLAAALLEQRLRMSSTFERYSAKVSRICNARHRADVYSRAGASIRSSAWSGLRQRVLRSLLASHRFVADCASLCPLVHGLGVGAGHSRTQRVEIDLVIGLLTALEEPCGFLLCLAVE